MSNLPQKLRHWLARRVAEPDVASLQAAINNLETDKAICDKEYAEHLRTVREERDGAEEELKMMTEWMNALTDALDRDIPSIAEQTPWPVGFYNFGRAQLPGTRYFNCGIVERAGLDYLIVRRSRRMPGSLVGKNDIMAFRLKDNIPQAGSVIAIPSSYTDAHHEDPRGTWMLGHLWVSWTTFQIVRGKITFCHQQVGAVSQADWSISKAHDPIYGNNGGSLYTQKGHEKNWLWFEHGGAPHCVYRAKPHTVVRWNAHLEAEHEYVTHGHNGLWQAGEVRGGTPPVRVGDEYFSFFHSSLPWIAPKRRYHMGAYAFKAEPPFPITRMSSLPILSGSKQDPWHQGLPLVVFPCGALCREGQWLVTLGVNDYSSAWIKIPHDDLLATLRPVTQPTEPSISALAPGNLVQPPAPIPQQPLIGTVAPRYSWNVEEE